MSFQQMPKLYLRGSLCNKTLKELTKEQQNQTEQLVLEISDDPRLRQCKIEFCNALARTIRNDYTDREVAEQDYMIAIMRGVVAAKFGYGDNPPNENAINDPIQRKKWFQTWVFNYLRQILRENKLPRQCKTINKPMQPDAAALYHLNNSINDTINSEHDFKKKRMLVESYQNAQTHMSDNGYWIKYNYSPLQEKLALRIKEINDMYLTYGVHITMTTNGIEITRTKSTPDITISQKHYQPVKMTRISNPNEDDEHQTSYPDAKGENNMQQIVENEIIVQLRDRLPHDTKQILDIYIEDTRPQDYIEKYGLSKPKIINVATYLGKTPKEIKKSISTIRLQCLALGVGQ